MKTIGVRDLRQRASEYLRDVQDGQSLEVTAHGKPVAQLVPVRRAGRRSLLVTRGRICVAVGDLLELGAPLRPAAGVPTASELLRTVRDSER